MNGVRTESKFRRRTGILGRCFIVADLDLEVRFGCKAGDFDTCGNFFVRCEVGVPFESIVEGVKVRGGNDVFNMGGLQVE